MTSSRVLARNTVLNVVGQVVPMLVALIAIPILIRALGDARFGILTLAWAAIGYFSLFDLGLSRALTQSLAVRLDAAADDRTLASVAWTALGVMFGLGLIGTVVLALLTPWLVGSLLNIPATLLDESALAFYLLAISLPCVVTTAGLRGILEAHQHFATVTALRVPLGMFTFVGPLIVLPYSTSLGAIVGVLVVGRGLTWLAYLVVCLRKYSFMRAGVVIRSEIALPLVRFGGWMTASNIMSPIMAYLDRFFIGAILPLAAVAHYVTPHEVVTKLLVFPQAMMGAIFPAFAATYGRNPQHTARIFERALRLVLLLMFPLLLTIVLFANEGLTAWVGAEFARASAPVLQWLAVGILLNSLAQAPFGVMQGIGRPDIPAKLHLAELPLYLFALWWLAHRYGIVGVAMAWTIRVAVDFCGLMILAMRHVPNSPRVVERTIVTAFGSLVVLALAAAPEGLAAKAAYWLATCMIFARLGWTRVIEDTERDAVRGYMRSTWRRAAPRQ